MLGSRVSELYRHPEAVRGDCALGCPWAVCTGMFCAWLVYEVSFCFFHGDKVSCSPGWPQTLDAAKDDLEPPILASYLPSAEIAEVNSYGQTPILFLS